MTIVPYYIGSARMAFVNVVVIQTAATPVAVSGATPVGIVVTASGNIAIGPTPVVILHPGIRDIDGFRRMRQRRQRDAVTVVSIGRANLGVGAAVIAGDKTIHRIVRTAAANTATILFFDNVLIQQDPIVVLGGS